MATRTTLKRPKKATKRQLAGDIDGGFVVKTASAVPGTEYSPSFIQSMVDRMHVSFFKYGPLRKGYPQYVSALKSLKLRLEKYEQTKNLEHLIDAANYCMIEFMHPSVEGATFISTDASGSPGRVTPTGKVSSKDNANI